MQETQYIKDQGLNGFNVLAIKNKMAIEWKYMNSDYIVRQEYLTYDINSLIADVGGYLGLLLGYSVLSIYQWLMGCIHKAFKAVLGRF